MLSPSDSVHMLPRKYLEDQLRVISTPTRFRQSLVDSVAFVGVGTLKMALGPGVLDPSWTHFPEVTP
jgi:hypothetical protein